MSGMFSAPKMPADPSIAAEKKRKEEQARTRDQFLSAQKQRSQSGRASTVLSQEAPKSTVLGG